SRDWSSDVCSSDLSEGDLREGVGLVTRRHTVLIALVIAAVWLITGCGTKSEPQASPQAEGIESASRVAFTLGTVAELRAYGPGAEEAVDAVVAELERLTAALGRFSPGSDVYR